MGTNMPGNLRRRRSSAPNFRWGYIRQHRFTRNIQIRHGNYYPSRRGSWF